MNYNKHLGPKICQDDPQVFILNATCRKSSRSKSSRHMSQDVAGLCRNDLNMPIAALHPQLCHICVTCRIMSAGVVGWRQSRHRPKVLRARCLSTSQEPGAGKTIGKPQTLPQTSPTCFHMTGA